MDMPRTSAMNQLSRSRASCRTIVGAVVVLGMCGLAGFADSAAQADPIPLSVMTSLQSGSITAIYETAFQIDGRTFRLTPDAVIQNEKGEVMEASSLVVTAEVKYHVKKEQNNQIDRMIVFLPR
ncbi:MAG: hypothetical protein Q7U39_12415 [Nitrospira sp.]|nr:hypothetical protein [Nitrospira sp.]